VRIVSAAVMAITVWGIAVSDGDKKPGNKKRGAYRVHPFEGEV